MTALAAPIATTSATNLQVKHGHCLSQKPKGGSYCRALLPHARASSRRLCIGTYLLMLSPGRHRGRGSIHNAVRLPPDG